jgi:DNA-binding transcriptional MocR family regulator
MVLNPLRLRGSLYVHTHMRMAVPGHVASTPMIDPTADRPVYKQLADLIRDEIQAGRLAAGQRLPAEHDYADEHGISRYSVRHAMGVLRREGLIRTDRMGSRVRDHGRMVVIDLRPGDVVGARMPTDQERRELRIDEGIPVIVVTRGADREIYPADRFSAFVADRPTD